MPNRTSPSISSQRRWVSLVADVFIGYIFDFIAMLGIFYTVAVSLHTTLAYSEFDPPIIASGGTLTYLRDWNGRSLTDARLTFPARAPGDVFTDMFMASLIPYPLVDNNWINASTRYGNARGGFVFSSTVTLLPAGSADAQLLVFNGVKMPATIYLIVPSCDQIRASQGFEDGPPSDHPERRARRPAAGATRVLLGATTNQFLRYKYILPSAPSCSASPTASDLHHRRPQPPAPTAVTATVEVLYTEKFSTTHATAHAGRDCADQSKDTTGTSTVPPARPRSPACAAAGRPSGAMGRYMSCSGGWDWAPYSHLALANGGWNLTDASCADADPTPAHAATCTIAAWSYSFGLWRDVHAVIVPRGLAAVTTVAPRVVWNGEYMTTRMDSPAWRRRLSAWWHAYTAWYSALAPTANASDVSAEAAGAEAVGATQDIATRGTGVSGAPRGREAVGGRVQTTYVDADTQARNARLLAPPHGAPTFTVSTMVALTNPHNSTITASVVVNATFEGGTCAGADITEDRFARVGWAGGTPAGTPTSRPTMIAFAQVGLGRRRGTGVDDNHVGESVHDADHLDGHLEVLLAPTTAPTVALSLDASRPPTRVPPIRDPTAPAPHATGICVATVRVPARASVAVTVNITVGVSSIRLWWPVGTFDESRTSHPAAAVLHHTQTVTNTIPTAPPASTAALFPPPHSRHRPVPPPDTFAISTAATRRRLAAAAAARTTYSLAVSAVAQHAVVRALRSLHATDNVTRDTATYIRIAPTRDDRGRAALPRASAGLASLLTSRAILDEPGVAAVLHSRPAVPREASSVSSNCVHDPHTTGLAAPHPLPAADASSASGAAALYPLGVHGVPAAIGRLVRRATPTTATAHRTRKDADHSTTTTRPPTSARPAGDGCAAHGVVYETAAATATVAFRVVAVVTTADGAADDNHKGSVEVHSASRAPHKPSSPSPSSSSSSLHTVLPDADGSGTNGFILRINGQLLAARGANMIPPHPHEGMWRSRETSRILDSAVGTNMGVLRVWGGGVWLPTYFYAAADDRGVVIYQDLMYAQLGHSPAATNDDQGLEIAYHARRLAQHPSVCLYAACNECFVGTARSDPTRVYVEFSLRQVLDATVDRSRPVMPSSPSAGWDAGVSALWGTARGDGAALRPRPQAAEAWVGVEGAGRKAALQARARAHARARAGDGTAAGRAAILAAPTDGAGATDAVDAVVRRVSDRRLAADGVGTGAVRHGVVIETHGPYNHGTGFPAMNGINGLRTIIPPLPPLVSTADTSPRLPNIFVSEVGSVTWSSFDAVAGTLTGANARPHADASPHSHQVRLLNGDGSVVGDGGGGGGTAASADPPTWGLHGGAPADICTPDDDGYVKHCEPADGTGAQSGTGNVMSQRNYPCDSIVDAYFGLTTHARRNTTDIPWRYAVDDVGRSAFQQQLLLCTVASGLHIKSVCETIRSRNTYGLLLWQLGEQWPTGGWGVLEPSRPILPATSRTTDTDKPMGGHTSQSADAGALGRGVPEGTVVGGRWKSVAHHLASSTFTDIMVTCTTNVSEVSGADTAAGAPASESHAIVCIVRTDVQTGAPTSRASAWVTAVDTVSGAVEPIAFGGVIIGGSVGGKSIFEVPANVAVYAPPPAAHATPTASDRVRFVWTHPGVPTTRFPLATPANASRIGRFVFDPTIHVLRAVVISTADAGATTDDPHPMQPRMLTTQVVATNGAVLFAPPRSLAALRRGGPRPSVRYTVAVRDPVTGGYTPVYVGHGEDGLYLPSTAIGTVCGARDGADLPPAAPVPSIPQNAPVAAPVLVVIRVTNGTALFVTLSTASAGRFDANNLVISSLDGDVPVPFLPWDESDDEAAAHSAAPPISVYRRRRSAWSSRAGNIHYTDATGRLAEMNVCRFVDTLRVEHIGQYLL